MEDNVVSYTFEMDERVKMQLERIALEAHRTLAAQIRMVLEDYINKVAPKKGIRNG